jgi:DNA-damage-inducible protein J
MDEKLKQQAEVLFDEVGMNMTTAITVFVKAAVRQNRIPFEIAGDQFYGASNMEVLRRSIRDADEGKLTAHDLIEA